MTPLAVLPFVVLPALRLGRIAIHPFGLLVAAGILTGAAVAALRARRLGLDETHFAALTLYTVAAGLLGAHVVELVAYHPGSLAAEPVALLRPAGLSSFGGFLGAAIAFVAYGRGRLPLLPAADALATGLPVGWLFGRAGCALVHDHPGVLSRSTLAVAYPGGARLDLGLMEFALTPLLIVIVLAVPIRWRRPGATVAALSIAYALFRFPLDALRAPAAQGGDERWLGLTAAQYGAVALLGVGGALAARRHEHGVPQGGEGHSARARGRTGPGATCKRGNAR